MRSHNQTDMTVAPHKRRLHIGRNGFASASTHIHSVKLRPHTVHITCQCITLHGNPWSEESWLPIAVLLRPARAHGAANGILKQGVLRAHCAAKLAGPQPKGLGAARVWVLSSVHSRQMAAQPEVDVVTTADWEWNYYHDYSLRVKRLAARLRHK